MREVNLETSAGFAIKNIHAGMSFPPVSFPRYADELKETPEDYPDGNYKWQICSDPHYEEVLFEYEEGDELQVVDNRVTVQMAPEVNELTEGLYFFRVIAEINQHVFKFVHGTINVNH